MQIKREGEPTFIPVVIVLESQIELEIIRQAVFKHYNEVEQSSPEESVLLVCLNGLQDV